ncbi:TerB family tellurite resistance protein [Candidatus Synechococcus calcipolaris G9]|uniref:TerB family tellurite resistance protein n=1 Tax=Candidatus Synechococcus calcipolaris G9 TaxID=1497997 RepID=A0ABT6EYA8_9SYNE|nr:TerB family tellurite resistance protein [Candidatus Synechococcus calcipolaris]MDG2990078.1 TerB family tellurite resistance protein [Candidatus Synechococcus calcipolaris G9]
MSPSPSLHQTLAIIICAAWADGHLDPQEIDYLNHLLHQYGLSQDPHLRSLLESPVSLQDTEQRIAYYLTQATESDRSKLLADIGTLLIVDNVVSPEEHQLLDDYYKMTALIPPLPEEPMAIAETVGRFVRQGLNTLIKAVHHP